MAYWTARAAESYLRTDFEESCGSLLPISMRIMRNFIVIHINNESTVCLWSNSCISSSSRIYIEIFQRNSKKRLLKELRRELIADRASTSGRATEWSFVARMARTNIADPCYLEVAASS